MKFPSASTGNLPGSSCPFRISFARTRLRPATCPAEAPPTSPAFSSSSFQNCPAFKKAGRPTILIFLVGSFRVPEGQTGRALHQTQTGAQCGDGKLLSQGILSTHATIYPACRSVDPPRYHFVGGGRFELAGEATIRYERTNIVAVYHFARAAGHSVHNSSGKIRRGNASSIPAGKLAIRGVFKACGANIQHCLIRGRRCQPTTRGGHLAFGERVLAVHDVRMSRRTGCPRGTRASYFRRRRDHLRAVACISALNHRSGSHSNVRSVITRTSPRESSPSRVSALLQRR